MMSRHLFSKTMAALELALFASITLGLGLSGCGNNDKNNSGEITCSTSEQCPDRNYCASSGVCRQDCDPRRMATGCAAGESCTSQGQCVPSTQSCVDNADCDSPPGGGAVCDGNTSVKPASIGRCLDQGEGLRCEYQDERTPCPAGCDGTTGECIPEVDPCLTVVCDSPPATRCQGNDLVTYKASGMCQMGGECSYPEESRQSCANGCDSATTMCNPSQGCDTITCDQPPAARCSDDNPELLITYATTGTCSEDGGAASCSYDSTVTDCRYAGGTCDQGACTVAKVQTGQVVITEFMVEPTGALNTFGHEWFEVINTTNADLDLNGWVIRSAGASGAVEEHTIDNGGPLTLAPGARLVLGRSSDVAGDASVSSYSYGSDIGLYFEDYIELLDGAGATVDYLFWEGGATLAGRSRKLDESAALTADGNDDFSKWCPSLSDAYGAGATNYGTPGAANTACVAAPCDNFSCGSKPEATCESPTRAITYMNDSAQCMPSRFNNPFCDFGLTRVDCDPSATVCVSGACQPFPTNLPTAGQVIITEVQGNPGGTDSEAEWIELYNTTDAELSLFSLKIEDNETGTRYTVSEVLDPAASIPAKGYAVLITNTDAATNGGIAGGVLLDSSPLKNTPDLDAGTGESLMRLRLTLRDGTLIDEAYYATPNSGGAAWQLNLSSYKDVASGADAANDTAANLCLATLEYDATRGKGSPGADNEACPAP